MSTALVDTIDLLYGPPLDVISNCLRGCIIAAPGHDLLVADFSAIEARGIAWLAGEERVLDVFRTGADIYCHAASDVYGRPISKKKDPDERQIGKVVVLACGYQGSVGAFQAMARGYGVKVPDAKVKEIVSAWRAANPAIVSYWYQAEEAAIRAVTNKGQVFTAGPPGREVKYLVRGSFLFCRLPSGRALSYPYPKLVPYVWIKRTTPAPDGGEPVTEQRRVPDRDLGRWLARGWKQNGEPQPALHYKYVDGLTKAWTEGPTYGGSLVENITQAVCRDLLAGAIVRLEARGYPIIMHVHDEVVSEVPEGVGDLAEFDALVAEAPAWAAGFPITAEGWRGKRYRK